MVRLNATTIQDNFIPDKDSAAGETNSDDNEGVNVNKDAERSAPAAGKAAATPDPNIVDWDGPNDSANPRNWSKAYKLTNVVVVSLSVLYTNLATTMLASGATTMQREFGFKTRTVDIMTITMASLSFALGQLFIPPMSEVFGRLLAGLPAASYMSTGGGTVADFLPKEERGVAMAIFTTGPLFSPVCCPFSTAKDPTS